MKIIKLFLKNGKQTDYVQSNSKACWCLFNHFLNNKKIPLIPSLFHEEKFLTDFKEKAEIFKGFFA